MTESKSNFLAALAATLQHEGGYSADALDPGGQTFHGISRVYWPTWPGWIKIDNWLLAGRPEMDLTNDVEDFYYINFWCRFQGDQIAAISPAVACELFDTAVNLGLSDAVRFFQTALNMQNPGQKLYPDLQTDGKLGPKTITTLQRYISQLSGNRAINETILLNCMNGEQYICYKNNPQHEYFRGWFGRV
jgi:lysozyme family protein